MLIRPAAEILLRHGDHALTLRASLRAAIALEAEPGGFAALFAKIAGQHVTAIRSVILTAATDRTAAERLLADASTKPLAPFVMSAQAACLALLMALIPAGQGETPKPTTPPAKPMPFGQYLADLFGYATGWLGWTPSEAWNASPAEISAALTAHIDRLAKLTPGASSPASDDTKERQREQNEAAGLDPDFDRAGLRALKAKM